MPKQYYSYIGTIRNCSRTILP